VNMPSAGADLGDQAAVAGEVLGSAEAIDGADFERDDDGQDDTHAGKS